MCISAMRAVEGFVSRRDYEYIESNREYDVVSVMFVGLVLAFAATRKEMALQSVSVFV